MNDNTPHDVIFDVIEPNDAGKMVCPMNIVQMYFLNKRQQPNHCIT